MTSKKRQIWNLLGRGLGLFRPFGDPIFAQVWPRIDSVEGLLMGGQERWLFETARSLPDGARILEIGSYKGRSTVSLAFGCLRSRKHVFAVDRFSGVYQDVETRENLRSDFARGFFHEWQENVRRCGLSDYVTPLIGDSKQIATLWHAPIQLIFIDGSHQYEDVVADFEAFFPHVAPNGIVACHDVIENWPGPYNAWHQHIRHKLVRTDAVGSLAYGSKAQ